MAKGAGIRLAALGAILLVDCAGAPKELPPRTPPQRVAPPVELPSEPIPEGRGRVVLYTTDGPMRIAARADLEFVPPGTNAAPTRMGELCTTPCVVDLPPAKYKLYLTSAGGDPTRGDVDVLKVGEGTTYYLRAPGRFESPRWIHVLPTLVILGGVALFTGGVVLAADPHDSGRQIAGLGLMGGGIAVSVVGGVYLYDESRGSTQEGATTTWSVPAKHP